MRKVRLYMVCSLTFFVLLISNSCSKNKEDITITIVWKDRKAIAIAIPNSISTSPESISVRRHSSWPATPILGSAELKNDSIVFTPLIPFTRGLPFEIFAGETPIARFTVPKPDVSEAPDIVAIYPSQDTLPENLLKMYLQFSQSMQEGKSAGYVALLGSNLDTIKGAFLDLQPELWNENRTQLTLWLDPGRIKRDLQPNKKLGAPLTKNQGYKIIISGQWKDAQGSPLVRSYSKSFVTIGRDSLPPLPESWKIYPPEPGSKNALQIGFLESMDHGLLDQAFHIISKKGANIPGTWQFLNEETHASFVPDENWKEGNYDVIVDTRLEDLASNNVNRPFDREISKEEDLKPKKDFVKIGFGIK